MALPYLWLTRVGFSGDWTEFINREQGRKEGWHFQRIEETYYLPPPPFPSPPLPFLYWNHGWMSRDTKRRKEQHMERTHRISTFVVHCLLSRCLRIKFCLSLNFLVSLLPSPLWYDYILGSAGSRLNHWSTQCIFGPISTKNARIDKRPDSQLTKRLEIEGVSKNLSTLQFLAAWHSESQN